MDSIKNIAFKILFIIWVTLWLVFGVREVFFKTNFNDYKTLMTRSSDGKRSYVTGDELYSFIEFCRASTPESSSYRIEGIKKGELDLRRAVYYLYPRVEKSEPDYILVYKKPGFAFNGYEPYKNIDESKFILKKMSVEEAR